MLCPGCSRDALEESPSASGTWLVCTHCGFREFKKRLPAAEQDEAEAAAPTLTSEPPTQHWYTQTWAAVVALLFLFPLGLFLMWRFQRWDLWIKTVITVAGSLFTILFVVAAAVGGDENGGGEAVGQEASPSPTVDVEATQTASALEAADATATATAEEEAAELEAEAEADLEYVVESSSLLDEGAEILDDFTNWIDDMVLQYNLGVMFPDTSDGQLALAIWEDYAQRVESLNVPPTFKESHDFWLAANSEMVTGMELAIAGAERFEPDLIEQGTAHMEEANRLLIKAQTALELSR